MKLISGKCRAVVGILGVVGVLAGSPVWASGSVGDHVNHLSDNLEKYATEVNWLIGKIDGIVDNYEQGGADLAKAEAVVDHWEAVNFHSAIETNFLPIYASIWQGLYGVKESIDGGQSLAQVKQEQEKLEQSLWQALGAVKLAAQFQERGLLDKIKTYEIDGEADPVVTLSEIKSRLDRVVAKYAEQLGKESVEIVHDTYLNLFEGVEGELIGLNADLVEDLEKDFNVTLPKAIQGNQGVDAVRQVVLAMQGKLDQARSLLKQAKASKKDVF